MKLIHPQDIINKHYPWDDSCEGHRVLRAYLVTLLRYVHLVNLDVPPTIMKAEKRMLSERKEKLDKYLERANK